MLDLGAKVRLSQDEGRDNWTGPKLCGFAQKGEEFLGDEMRETCRPEAGRRVQSTGLWRQHTGDVSCGEAGAWEAGSGLICREVREGV